MCKVKVATNGFSHLRLHLILCKIEINLNSIVSLGRRYLKKRSYAICTESRDPRYVSAMIKRFFQVAFVHFRVMISRRCVQCRGRPIGTTIFTYPCIPSARVSDLSASAQCPRWPRKEIFNLSTTESREVFNYRL